MEEKPKWASDPGSPLVHMTPSDDANDFVAYCRAPEIAARIVECEHSREVLVEALEGVLAKLRFQILPICDDPLGVVRACIAEVIAALAAAKVTKVEPADNTGSGQGG